MNGHHPGANAIPMNNMRAGNGWEQELFQGNVSSVLISYFWNEANLNCNYQNNGMPIMFGQPLFPSPDACRQIPDSFFQDHSADTSPHIQATPSRMAAFGHQSQPQSQPQSQSPRENATQSRPFSSIHFQSAEEACDYLNETVWYPSMGNYGIPQTDKQYRFYLLKLCKALQNTTNVWDAGSAPWNHNKFLPGSLGEWSKPKDIEAIAHMVLNNTMRVHEIGVKNLAHRRSTDYMSCNREDKEFTFPQRIHFLAELLAHSKTAAAEIMHMMNVEKYIAIPITMLRLFEPFDQRWKGTVGMEKRQWLELEPYNGTGVAHPMMEEQGNLRNMTARRPICDEGILINHGARSPAQTAATPMQQPLVAYSDGGIAGGRRPATEIPGQQERRTPKRGRARALAPYPADE